jgi:hypothetical protein
MEKYEDTIKDIEKTLGIVPGFMKGLPKDVLIQEWPLFKKYNFEAHVVLGVKLFDTQFKRRLLKPLREFYFAHFHL